MQSHLVRHFSGEQFPQDHAEGPHIHLLRAQLIPDHLRGHPRHCPSEGHLGALLIPLLAGTKVRYLEEIIRRHEYAAKANIARVMIPRLTCETNYSC